MAPDSPVVAQVEDFGLHANPVEVPNCQNADISNDISFFNICHRLTRYVQKGHVLPQCYLANNLLIPPITWSFSC